MKQNRTNHQQNQDDEIGVIIYGKPQPLPMGSKLDKVFQKGLMDSIQQGCKEAWVKLTSK